MTAIDTVKLDSLQALSERLQQLSDVSSRFDALTKETEDKLDNVTKTANVLQQKMSPINEKMEHLRHRRKAYEACKVFLKQTSSYQTTTEKYIKDLHQTKIIDVEEFVASLTKAKESLDFFTKFLPQEKNAANLMAIVSEGSKNLSNKFKEIVSSLSEAARFSPEMCRKLACKTSDVQSFAPSFDKKSMKDIALITDWLDKENMSGLYLSSYTEVRAITLESTMKKLRNTLIGTGGNAPFGASPSVSRKSTLRDTPSKVRSIPRRPKSRNQPLGLPPALGLDGAEQLDIDHEDLGVMITAFIRLCKLEFEILEKFGFKVENLQILADRIINRAKESLIEDMRKFTAGVRREFKQDPESLLRLVAVLDQLRKLQPELTAALAPCSESVRTQMDDLAKEMRAQASSNLEDYRDDVVRDNANGQAKQPVPADGTVHELTLQALKFLKQLHEFEHTTYSILCRDTAAAADAKTRRKKIGEYLSCTLAKLLHSLEAKSVQYSDSVLSCIFLLNNFRYVHQRLDREKITPTIEAFNCEVVKFFEEHHRKHKENYLNRGLQKCAAPLMSDSSSSSSNNNNNNSSSSNCADAANCTVGNPVGAVAALRHRSRQKHADVVKLSDREKSLIKEKFKSFNDEFMAAYKTQSNYSVPDPDLKSELINDNKEFLLGKYAMFREKYNNVPFTSKKEKYIKYTCDDIERMLGEFFRGD